MNKVILIGHAGKDTEVKQVTEDFKVAKLSLATTERYTKNGEKQEKTTWHNLVAYNKVASLLGDYVHKGDKICVIGKIETRSYESDGTTKYITEVIVNELEFLGGKRGESVEEKPPSEADLDDMPF